ncbi:MAG: DUF5320 domain-containing protein [Thermoplasmata archaeon]|nr:DUF5320 domain-containing protein [Thermoplasmata archaeon]
MPGGDRTGPWGRGSRTGRALGYCAGNEVPGYTRPEGARLPMRAFGGGRGQGFGCGMGFRRGRGRGFYDMDRPAYAPPSREDEIGQLDDLRNSLEQELESVRQRLKALSKTE